MSISVAVVRVFTDSQGRFGNPLGIVAAESVPETERQAVASRIGFSETVFFERTGPDSAATFIYTPAAQLPFAGHPTVGLSWWLREQGHSITTLTVPSADLHVRYDGDLTWVRARAEWTPQFTMHPVDSPADVEADDPNAYDSGHHYVWSWIDESAGSLRSRMFAPLMGIAEDEATGAAAVRITDQLGRDLDITQGRGSLLHTRIDAERWTHLGGRVVAEKSITV